MKAGGLQFNSFEIGSALSLTGFVQLFAQLVIWPMMEKRYSNIQILRMASVLMAVFSFALPFCHDYALTIISSVNGVYTPNEKSAVYCALVALISGKTVASVLGYIPVIILVNDSCPPNGSLGTVHGCGQVSASFMR
jgi:hypothetical protein